MTVLIDWPQIVAMVSTMVMLSAAFAAVVRHIIRHELNEPWMQIEQTERNVTHIDGELRQHIPGYRPIPEAYRRTRLLRSRST